MTKVPIEYMALRIERELTNNSSSFEESLAIITEVLEELQRESIEECANLCDERGNQAGIMRSVEMTQKSDTCHELAKELRTLKPQ